MPAIPSVGLSSLRKQRERVHEQAEPLESIELALDRDQERIRRHHGIDGQEAEAGRRIDEDVVVVGVKGLEGVLEAAFAARKIHELDLRTGKSDVGRNNVEPWNGGMQAGLGERSAHHDDVVDAGLDATPIDSKTGRGVGLGIDVDQEHLPAHLGERSAHADGRGGLSNTALLVGDRENARWHG